MCEVITTFMNQEKHIARVLGQFRNLKKAVIDASSIIYLKKTGCLDTMAYVIDLYAPEQIAAETGFSDLPVDRIPYPSTSLCNDDILRALADAMRLPVISEDKKILLWAKGKELPHFNTLMMLNFLLYKKKISQEQLAAYRRKLRAFSWYGPTVFAFASEIQCAILEGRKKDRAPRHTAA
jgi:hypothetical protein